MQTQVPPNFVLSKEVSRALYNQQPVVALESAMVTHGLPHPENLQLALDLSQEVRLQGSVPAMIAILGGKVQVGLSQQQIEYLSSLKEVRKISRRDFGIAISRKEDGGTTVAGTLIAASAVGIRIFATGGIGGVHQRHAFDISADLPELSRTPMIVVCSGAKAILDLPATLEYLETCGVPVIGYQTDEFPAFYSASSGLPVNYKAQMPGEIAHIAQKHWEIGLKSAILVANPPPADNDIPRDQIDQIIQQAISESDQRSLSGSQLTPFLLQRISELTQGASLKTNLALLRNNSALAGQIASAIFKDRRDHWI
jgi:pseudouridine-5'-phosphate glycosidase